MAFPPYPSLPRAASHMLAISRLQIATSDSQHHFHHSGTSLQSPHRQHEAWQLISEPAVGRNKPGICLRHWRPELLGAPDEEDHPIQAEARRTQTADFGEESSRWPHLGLPEPSAQRAS